MGAPAERITLRGYAECVRVAATYAGPRSRNTRESAEIAQGAESRADYPWQNGRTVLRRGVPLRGRGDAIAKKACRSR